MSLGGLHQEGKVPVGEQGRAARLRRERRAAFRGLVCLLTASVSLVTARLHMRLSHPSCVRALSRSLSHAGNSPKPEFQLTQRHTVSDLTCSSSFFSFKNLYFSWVFVQLWVQSGLLFFCWRSCGLQSGSAAAHRACGPISDHHRGPGPTVIWTCINIQIQSVRRHTWRWRTGNMSAPIRRTDTSGEPQHVMYL